MKQKNKLVLALFLLIFTCISLGSCDTDDWYADDSVLTDESHGALTNHYVVATGDAKNVTFNSATILCSANYNYKESLSIKPGIVYSTYNDLRNWGIEVPIFTEDFTKSEFEVRLVNLKPGTTYYYCTYAYSGYNKSYGYTKSFKTPEVVATGKAKNVTHNSATILCTANYSYRESLKPGIIYSTSDKELEYSNPNTTHVDIQSFTSSELQVNLNNLKHSTTYYYRAYVIAGGNVYYGDIESFTTSFDLSTIEAVDLGLSVKWASMNIGATKPEELGDSFYWGQTSASTSKDWHEFALSTLMSHGYIDSNDNLCPSYDTATELWGNKWRMPTQEEVQELMDKCTWKKIEKNGTNVFLITGPNSNVIYMPVREYKSSYYYGNDTESHYWTSTASSSAYSTSYYLSLDNGSYKGKRLYGGGRSSEMYIRPVMK